LSEQHLKKGKVGQNLIWWSRNWLDH